MFLAKYILAVSFLLIVVFFALWALVHSALAGRRCKTRARSLLGERGFRWYRLSFNLFAALSLAPVLWLSWRLPDLPLYSASGVVRWLMLGVQASCGLVIVMVVRRTGMGRFLGFEQITHGGEPRAGALNVGGLYRYVRHPLYLLGLVVIWVSPVMTRNSLALGAVMSAYFWLGSIHEEQQLIDEFGDRYRHYRETVPRIIPRPGRTYEAKADSA